MEETKTLQSAADTILDKSVSFDVDIIHPTIWDKLNNRTKKTFSIPPSTLGTMIKISKELLSVDVDVFAKEEILNSNLILISNHAETMARIVALAVVNTRQEPSKSMISFFIDNLTSKELYDLVGIIITQIDTINFMKSIISARGVNLLSRMNPQTQGSTIAPGKQ